MPGLLASRLALHVDNLSFRFRSCSVLICFFSKNLMRHLISLVTSKMPIMTFASILGKSKLERS